MRAAATVAAVAAATLTVGVAQQTTSAPVILSDTGLPGIDRGLRADPSDYTVPRESERIRQLLEGDRTFLPGSLIVKFRPGTSIPARNALVARVDGSATPPLPYASFDVVALGSGVDPEAAAGMLAAQPDVEYAQARYINHPRFVPNDQLYSRQWNLTMLDMERAWDINPGAAPTVTVAVLDTGIAYRTEMVRYTLSGPFAQLLFPGVAFMDVPFAAAPDLAGPDRFVAPRDFIWETTTPRDLEGHGTHVAGTVGQLTNNNIGVAGVAFNVRIMPVKVLANLWDVVFGSPFLGTDDVVARGIRYAAENGAHVINMSVGRVGPPAPAIQDAVNFAVSRGVFVAVAAGNDFLAGNPLQRPADLAPQIAGMVSVGAVARTRQRAPYSSTGSYIELAAPGGDFGFPTVPGVPVLFDPTGGVLQQTFDPLVSFIGGPFSAPRFDMFVYAYAQGTSMAAPHVAGFAALLRQQGITSPAAIEDAMKRFATDLGPPGVDDEFGAGLINPRATLRGMGLAK